jgi:acyl carrier protein
MMKTIEERITKVLLDDFKIQHESISADATFADLSFDSLVIVELAMVLDGEFGITLEFGELTDTMTITEAAELMMAKGAVP